MTEMEQVKAALEAVEKALPVADRFLGLVNRIHDPKRRARYCRWRGLRLRLRAVDAQSRGQVKQANKLRLKAQIWIQEAAVWEGALAEQDLPGA